MYRGRWCEAEGEEKRLVDIIHAAFFVSLLLVPFPRLVTAWPADLLWPIFEVYVSLNLMLCLTDAVQTSGPGRAYDLPHLLPVAVSLSLEAHDVYFPRTQLITNRTIRHRHLSKPSSISIHPPFWLFMFLHSNAIHASGDPPYSA